MLAKARGIRGLSFLSRKVPRGIRGEIFPDLIYKFGLSVCPVVTREGWGLY